MSDASDHSGRRRRFLKTTAGGIAGFVGAGCVSDGDSTAEPTPGTDSDTPGMTGTDPQDGSPEDTPTNTSTNTPTDTPDDLARAVPSNADRRWISPVHWANPLQDWRVTDGRIERDRGDQPADVHHLTKEITEGEGEFEISVRVGGVTGTDSATSAAGIKFIQDNRLDDYRHRVFVGDGDIRTIDIGLREDGKIALNGPEGVETSGGTLPESDVVELTVLGQQQDGNRLLAVFGRVPGGDEEDAVAVRKVYPEPFGNGIALWSRSVSGGTVSFEDWTVSGEKIADYPDRSFGPILFTMYTVSEGTLNLTAQMAPLGDNAAPVALELDTGDGWSEVDTATIDDLARTARFTVDSVPRDADTPYRVVYDDDTYEETVTFEYTGTIRGEPDDGEEFVVGALSCQKETGHPYPPIAEGVSHHDPDMLFFTGDQFYEDHNGYGVASPGAPLEVSSLDYLRKWYMHGAAFGDLMADRPTVCLLDDHDIYQGNIWGSGGNGSGNWPDQGPGYGMPTEWINMAQRTQTSHLPAPHDPTPIENDIGVYYTSVEYGGVSFAVVEDRKWKTAPSEVSNLQDGIEDATLLGDRQLAFLEEWGAMSEASLNVVVSQTIWAAVPTHTSRGLVPTFNNGDETGDEDANGWPPQARDEAVETLSQVDAFHLGGDQHLPMVVQYGVEEFDDAPFNYAVPGVSVGWTRAFTPDRDQSVHGRTKQGNLPVDVEEEYAGQWFDAFDNRISMYAVRNPELPSDRAPTSDVLQYMQDKSSGYGILRFDTDERTITMEAWPVLSDPSGGEDEQMDGWPLTVDADDWSLVN
jgi:phosphodiesterase/alkaline phosphatase D-like protein